MSLIEMALGRYPIPQPSMVEIAEEMKERPAGELPPREGGNSYASHANAIRMPIFELLQIITTSVRLLQIRWWGKWEEHEGVGKEGGA